MFASIKQGVGRGTWMAGAASTGFTPVPRPATNGAGTAAVAGVARPGMARPATDTHTLDTTVSDSLTFYKL